MESNNSCPFIMQSFNFVWCFRQNVCFLTMMSFSKAILKFPINSTFLQTYIQPSFNLLQIFWKRSTYIHTERKKQSIRPSTPTYAAIIGLSSHRTLKSFLVSRQMFALEAGQKANICNTRQLDVIARTGCSSEPESVCFSFLPRANSWKWFFHLKSRTCSLVRLLDIHCTI